MRNLSRQAQDRLLFAAVAAAPFVVVQGIRLLDHDPVAGAAAQPIQVEEVDSQVSTQVPSASESRAIRWTLSRTFDDVGNPFYLPPAEPQPQPESVPLPKPDAGTPASSPIPRFELTSVIKGSKRALAAINQRVWRIGDEVEPGWLLKQLNARERSAVLQSTDGRTVRIVVSDPASSPSLGSD